MKVFEGWGRNKKEEDMERTEVCFGACHGKWLVDQTTREGGRWKVGGGRWKGGPKDDRRRGEGAS